MLSSPVDHLLVTQLLRKFTTYLDVNNSQFDPANLPVDCSSLI
jgi:hypothetical protein